MTNRVCVFWVGLLGLISMSVSAAPNTTSSFYIDWSGASYNNSAKAHAMLTVNTAEGSKFTGFADNAWLAPDVDVTDFTITISDAESGNGTFGLSEFDFFMWNTSVTEAWPLDLSREVFGQNTTGGAWGSDHSSDALTGDFNLFAIESSLAPTSDGGAFRIATNAGYGDRLNLTSFRPVPIPAAFWLFGSTMLGFAGVNYGRRAV